jgi:hypothetical protein
VRSEGAAADEDDAGRGQFRLASSRERGEKPLPRVPVVLHREATVAASGQRVEFFYWLSREQTGDNSNLVAQCAEHRLQ